MPIDARDSVGVVLQQNSWLHTVLYFNFTHVLQLGLTCLMHASQYGWPEIVKELLKRGASLDLQDKVEKETCPLIDLADWPTCNIFACFNYGAHVNVAAWSDFTYVRCSLGIRCSRGRISQSWR